MNSIRANSENHSKISYNESKSNMIARNNLRNPSVTSKTNTNTSKIQQKQKWKSGYHTKTLGSPSTSNQKIVKKQDLQVRFKQQAKSQNVSVNKEEYDLGQKSNQVNGSQSVCEKNQSNTKDQKDCQKIVEEIIPMNPNLEVEKNPLNEFSPRTQKSPKSDKSQICKIM